MASADSLNWDQHSMKEGHVRSLFKSDKDRQAIVIRALAGARMIGSGGGSKHVKIFIEGDGLVTTASTGGGGRGAENFESQLRRAHRSVGMDFPRHGENPKAFQRRMERKKGNVNE